MGCKYLVRCQQHRPLRRHSNRTEYIPWHSDCFEPACRRWWGSQSTTRPPTKGTRCIIASWLWSEILWTASHQAQTSLIWDLQARKPNGADIKWLHTHTHGHSQTTLLLKTPMMREPRCSPDGKTRTARNRWKPRPKWIWIRKCPRFWWANSCGERVNTNKKEDSEERGPYNMGRYQVALPWKSGQQADTLKGDCSFVQDFTNRLYYSLYRLETNTGDFCFRHWPWEADCHYSWFGSVQPRPSDSAVSRQP